MGSGKQPAGDASRPEPAGGGKAASTEASQKTAHQVSLPASLDQVPGECPLDSLPVIEGPTEGREQASFSKAGISITTEEVSRGEGQGILAAFYESSSYPPPSYLAEYEKIVPGLASKVMTWIEDESKFRRKEDALQSSHEREIETARAVHRSRLETRAMDLAEKSMGWGNFRANVGMFLAWPLVVCIVVAGTYLIHEGHDAAGTTMVVSGLGTVVGAFILNKLSVSQERSADDKESEEPEDS